MQVFRNYRTKKVEFGLEVNAKTCKLFENQLFDPKEANKPLQEKAVQQFEYTTLYFCDLVNDLARAAFICNIVETIFLSQNGKPIFIARNCEQGSPKEKKERVSISLTKITPTESINTLVKDFLKRFFGFWGEFSNQILIEYLSDPAKNKLTVCHASY